MFRFEHPDEVGMTREKRRVTNFMRRIIEIYSAILIGRKIVDFGDLDFEAAVGGGYDRMPEGRKITKER